MTKHRTATFSCPVCGVSRPSREAVPLEVLHGTVRDRLVARAPELAEGAVVCSECVLRARADQIEDLLEQDRGELSKLEEDVIRSLEEQDLISSNLNVEFDRRLTLGERMADRIAEFGGSWTFIGIFAFVLVVWMIVNSISLLRHPFDPYPYILLNLVLSCLAAIQAPVIMMSQNRQEAKDRLRAENDYRVNLKAELEIRQLNQRMDQLIRHQWQRLLEIQRIQVELMEGLATRSSARPRGGSSGGGVLPEGP